MRKSGVSFAERTAKTEKKLSKIPKKNAENTDILMRMCSENRPYICACPFNGNMCNEEIIENEYCHVEHNEWLRKKINETSPTEISIKDIKKVMKKYDGSMAERFKIKN